MELVTPNVGTIFWMIIVFGIVAFVLKRFAWKPILNALTEREQSIESALSAAQQARREMESLKAGNEELLAKAQKEREAIMREALKLKENILSEAKVKADRALQFSVENAKKQIENEKAKAIEEMKKQMAELSFLIAEKILRKEMSDSKSHNELVKQLIEEIKLN